jgi:hypothetical protein
MSYCMRFKVFTVLTIVDFLLDNDAVLSCT